MRVAKSDCDGTDYPYAGMSLLEYLSSCMLTPAPLQLTKDVVPDDRGPQPQPRARSSGPHRVPMVSKVASAFTVFG
jgi:hypothetical protein